MVHKYMLSNSQTAHAVAVVQILLHACIWRGIGLLLAPIPTLSKLFKRTNYGFESQMLR